ncbi:MAG: hypothetical protein NZ828_09065 [Alphaproteobacteria bacterium]|nr:hypothetical protein [Alphaproteobacteria bacterium]
MLQGKSLDLHELKKLDKNEHIQRLYKENMDSLNQAVDLTFDLTELFLSEHVFDYCVVITIINDLNSYIETASHRQADILLKKIDNIFEAMPKNRDALNQAPIKKLLETAKSRIRDPEAYKIKDDNTHNYEFMVNMSKLERILAKADHPFIILTLNAANMFNALVTTWKMNHEKGEELATRIMRMLNKHKDASPFFEAVYKDSAFICLEALCFDVNTKVHQIHSSAASTARSVYC